MPYGTYFVLYLISAFELAAANQLRGFSVINTLHCIVVLNEKWSELYLPQATQWVKSR